VNLSLLFRTSKSSTEEEMLFSLAWLHSKSQKSYGQPFEENHCKIFQQISWIQEISSGYKRMYCIGKRAKLQKVVR